MPSEETKILVSNSYQKSDKTSSIVYADLEYLIKRTYNVNIILKNHLQHMPFGYSLSMIWAFNGIEIKYNKFRSEDYMKNNDDN